MNRIVGARHAAPYVYLEAIYTKPLSIINNQIAFALNASDRLRLDEAIPNSTPITLMSGLLRFARNEK